MAGRHAGGGQGTGPPKRHGEATAATRRTGRPLPRAEDAAILAGRAQYVDDIVLPGMLYAGFVRSPYAHARVRRVDFADALAMPGVVAAFGPGQGPFNFAPGGKVRYQGEAVGMLVAVDPYVLQDALERVAVDYQPLPAVLDMFKALEPGAPVIDEERGTNVAEERVWEGGDVKAEMSRGRVLEGRLTVERVIPAAMEPRGAVATYDGETLTIWSSTQSPYAVRREVAKSLDIPLARVRAMQPFVGGAFGSKYPVYPEELWVAAAAFRLRRPVKWIATRTEDMRATVHGRGIVLDYRAGVDGEGRLLAIEATMYVDAGGYPNVGPFIPANVATLLPGPYAVRAGRVRGLIVLTNKTPLGAYRGAGRPEATFFIERIMDQIADELGLDPVEVRERNLIRQLPYRNVFGLEYDTGDYPATFKRGLERLGYRDLLRWAEEESRRTGRLIGVGFSTYVTISARPVHELAILRAERDGTFTLYTSTTAFGQGLPTALAQVVAEELQVPPERVRVVWGDSNVMPEGYGTSGSRGITAGGSVTVLAARRLLQQLAGAAEQLLGCRPQYGDGQFRCDGKAVRIEEVVEAIYGGRAKGDLVVQEIYHPTPTFPFGVNVAVVEVDPETGLVRPVLHRTYDDVGVVVNPLLAEGQVHGGALQGISQALYEEVAYDAEGSLATTNFAFYGLPTAADSPTVEAHFAEEPHPSRHPVGSKGIGEAPVVASIPAVVQAVERAIRRVNPKARLAGTPVRPEELLRLLGRL